jgi:tagaturonate epimerase
VGRFEKGVDYIGDLDELRLILPQHAAITRVLGPYKLSLHSGSDKFSVYPLIAEATRGQVHVKTAGTSYLEALRVLALYEPDFFRDILAFSRECYERDRASYHVSAELSRVPDPIDLKDAQLVSLLEDFDARQVLHVTYGSVLGQFDLLFQEALTRHLDAYSADLKRHMDRHIEPFLPYGRKD